MNRGVYRDPRDGDRKRIDPFQHYREPQEGVVEKEWNAVVRAIKAVVWHVIGVLLVIVMIAIFFAMMSYAPLMPGQP